MRRDRGLLISSAVVLGLALGWVSSQILFSRHSHNLFSPRPLRRLAALGFLEGDATAESLQVLRDYLDWERHPVLRRKARVLVKRLERRFG